MINHATAADKPLWFHWRAHDEDWAGALDLPPAANRNHARARSSILLEAVVTAATEPERWISYSRRKGWYDAQGRRYRSPAHAFATVPRAVDGLARLGLLEHDKAPAGRLGRQSRFRAAPALRAAMALPPAVHDPGEVIRLRGADDDLVDYRDTDETLRMRRRLKPINEALRAAGIAVAGIDGPIGAMGDTRFHTGQDQLHRVFNRSSFRLGGRFYGGFWQNLPQATREALVLDGEPTHEADYARLHPRLLYAEAGAALEGDAYALDGFEDDRPLVKRAFNIAVNADTEMAAVRAIAQEIGGKGAHAKAGDLLDAIRARHRPIAPCFGSGAGLRLQRRDADLAERVLLRLLRRGIVALPIHDSFVVRRRHAGARDEAMDAELGRLLATLLGTAKCVSLPATCANTGPHNGGLAGWRACWRWSSAVPVPGPGVAPAPARPLALLAGADLVSGGLAPLLVPANDLERWGEGTPSEATRAALRHELRARGLTQKRLARQVGLSRPQLTNLLRGRVGTSPEAAARLKAFLLEAA